MQTVLITGANRGIGLGVARRYAERGDRVLAGCRNPDEAAALDTLRERTGQVQVLPLEVTSEASIEAAVEAVTESDGKVDILLNNAGISPGDVTHRRADGRAVFDADRALDMFRVNAVAPLLLAQTFLPLLRRGTTPRIVNVSSGAGSLAYKTEGGLYSYSASKAAQNMYTRALAADLRDVGVTVVALDPGWVKTDLGGPNAWITVEESATGIVSVIDTLTLDDTGEFFHYKGEHVPW